MKRHLHFERHTDVAFCGLLAWTACRADGRAHQLLGELAPMFEESDRHCRARGMRTTVTICWNEESWWENADSPEACWQPERFLVS